MTDAPENAAGRAVATIVDASAVPWANGMDVYDTMEPAFRENLGDDPAEVRMLLSRYNMKALWTDPVTSRRIDHVQADPGYVDLSEAYHDSVEESYFLGGEVELTAEGTMLPGDYFWRPPGWVHSARSPLGFECLLMMEGEDATEGSSRVSRVVRPDDEAGHQARPGVPNEIGPRGYVRRAETRYQVWRAHDDTATALGGSGQLRSKTLSDNATTGGRSVLVAAAPGWVAERLVSNRDRFVVNTSGSIVVDGAQLPACSLVHVPAHASFPPTSAPEGAELLVKVGRPR